MRLFSVNKREVMVFAFINALLIMHTQSLCKLTNRCHSVITSVCLKHQGLEAVAESASRSPRFMCTSQDACVD